MLLFADIMGLIGVALIVGSYFLLQYNFLHKDSLTYLLMNFIGPFFILFSLYFKWNLSAAIIEIVWLAITIHSLWRLFCNKCK